MDEGFWDSRHLRLAVARAMHRQNFASDSAAERHWLSRPSERACWLNRAPRIIDAVRVAADTEYGRAPAEIEEGLFAYG